LHRRRTTPPQTTARPPPRCSRPLYSSQTTTPTPHTPRGNPPRSAAAQGTDPGTYCPRTQQRTTTPHPRNPRHPHTGTPGEPRTRHGPSPHPAATAFPTPPHPQPKQQEKRGRVLHGTARHHRPGQSD
jgi:hypothetical protein